MGPEREQALADGCAPVLATAVDADVTRALTAERSAHYLNILYALLLLRRGHELEPRHEDLYARLLPPQRRLGPYDAEAYARDLEQLLDWGCLERLTEAQRLRGYKDNRRLQYRYRISTDALALIEWLEARLAAKIEGRVRDSRDRLADIVGALKECRRLLDAWRKGSGDADSARRSYYLVELVADAVSEISDELLLFRAEMIGFAQRPYDLAALREILGWLERYVDLYIRRIRELQLEIRDRLEQLGAPRYRAALDDCAAEVRAAHEQTPRFLRAAAPLRAPGELVDAVAIFFRHGGRLQGLCRAVEESARSVLVKMHRHVRELERRNARLDDLRATIRGLAAAPDDARAADYAGHLLASAHGRFDVRPGSLGHRVAPPAPRKQQLASDRRAARPLSDKRASPAEARALRAKELAELRRWLAERLLAGAPHALLSQTELGGADDLRRWMDVARARHLAGGRNLRALGVAIAGTGARARLGDDETGMDAPDCELRTVEDPR